MVAAFVNMSTAPEFEKNLVDLAVAGASPRLVKGFNTREINYVCTSTS
jgi:hypothetical protein